MFLPAQHFAKRISKSRTFRVKADQDGLFVRENDNFIYVNLKNKQIATSRDRIQNR
mgnify:CR=1 FL=1